MAKGAKKGGRVRDKWRDKQWIVINAPSAFGGSPLNYVPITDADRAKGRVIENTMFDIFKGHEYAKEFLRSLIRRGSSMINDVYKYTTLDGHTFRVAVIAFSQRRLNASKKHQIRIIARHILTD